MNSKNFDSICQNFAFGIGQLERLELFVTLALRLQALLCQNQITAEQESWAHFKEVHFLVP